MTASPKALLLVEDNPSDIRIFHMAIAERNEIRLHVVTDGEQALEWLTACHASDLPDRIVLDLNMPRKGGRELIRDIRRNPAWEAIPLTVLTTSDSERDLTTCRELGIDAYYLKPPELEDFLTVLRKVLRG